jgi:hypothetical protein
VLPLRYFLKISAPRKKDAVGRGKSSSTVSDRAPISRSQSLQADCVQPAVACHCHSALRPGDGRMSYIVIYCISPRSRK